MSDLPVKPVILTAPTRERPSAWTFQLRVIKALILRDMMGRYSDRRLNYLWPFVQQALIIAAFIIAFTVRGRTGSPSLPVVVFILTGYPLYQGFMAMWSSVAGACTGGTGGLGMFPQITMLDVVISRILLDFATETSTSVVMYLAVVAIGLAEAPADPLSVMMAYWGAMTLGVGVGFVAGSIRRYIPHFEDILRPVRRLGIFISGVVIVGTEVPSFLRPYFFWNPVFKCIEIARTSWHPSYHSPIAKPFDVITVCVCLLAAGLLLERATRRNSTQ